MYTSITKYFYFRRSFAPFTSLLSVSQSGQNFTACSLQPYHICLYIEALNLKGLAPPTIKNTIGHIRTHLRLAAAPPVADHHRVVWALDAIMRRKDFVPKTKPEVPLHVFKAALNALPANREIVAVRAVLLMLYYAALRQSEVVPPSVGQFDPLRHLTRNDVSITEAGVTVLVKAAKNLQKYNQRRLLRIPASDAPELCMKRAIQAVTQLDPTKDIKQPMFVFRDTVKPIPASYIRNQWKAALKNIGIPLATYTLHGLRSTATTTAFDAGHTERQVQHYGAWASDAYKVYIKRKQDMDIARQLTKSLKLS